MSNKAKKIKLRHGNSIEALQTALKKSEECYDEVWNENEKLRKSVSERTEMLLDSAKKILELSKKNAKITNQLALLTRTTHERMENDVVSVISEEMKADFANEDRNNEYPIIYPGDESPFFRTGWNVKGYLAERSPTLKRILEKIIEQSRPKNGTKKVNGEDRENRKELMVCMIFANLFYAISTHARFELGRRLSLMLKSRGESGVCDFVCKFVPGAVSASAINASVDAIIDNRGGVARREHYLPDNLLGIVTFDNLTYLKKGGNSYNGGHPARLGHMEHIVSVVTQMMAIMIKQPNQSIDMLQTCAVHGPDNWLKLSSTPSNILEVRTSKKLKEDFEEDELIESNEVNKGSKKSVQVAIGLLQSYRKRFKDKDSVEEENDVGWL